MIMARLDPSAVKIGFLTRRAISESVRVLFKGA